MDRQNRGVKVPLQARGSRISDDEFRVMTEFPEYYGEETMSGNMPNPESDDDTLEAVQQWGLYLKATTPAETEINLDKEITEADKRRKRT